MEKKLMNEAKIKQAFEKVFPKVYERPGIYPFKTDIYKIVKDTVEALLPSSTMPWDKEL
jgi:hypothetical protein